MKMHQDFRKRKVLVVDDSIVQVLMTQQILRKWNLIVDVAYNAHEAVEKSKGCEYDLIMVDSRLPGINGPEAVGKIRETRLGRTPVFFVTASTFEEAIGAEHVAEVVLKPFSLPQLNEKLYKHLAFR